MDFDIELDDSSFLSPFGTLNTVSGLNCASLIKESISIEKAGAFSIVLECVTHSVAKKLQTF